MYQTMIYAFTVAVCGRETFKAYLARHSNMRVGLQNVRNFLLKREHISYVESAYFLAWEGIKSARAGYWSFNSEIPILWKSLDRS